MLRKAALVVFSCLLGSALGLALLEGALRLRPRSTPDQEPIGPSGIDVRLHTDEFDMRVITNRQGIRENHPIGAKPEGGYRILVVGDSYTFGWGVDAEQTYGRRMQAILRERLHTAQLEVVNLGRPGADPFQYVEFVRKLGLSLDPDLIVVGFLYGNDSLWGSPRSWPDDPVKAVAAARSVLEQRQAAAARPAPPLRFWGLLRPLFKAAFWKKRLTHPRGGCDPVWNQPDKTYTRDRVIELYGADSAELRRYDKLDQAGWIERARECRILPYRVNEVVSEPDYWLTILGLNPQKADMVRAMWGFSHEPLSDLARLLEKRHVPLLVAGLPSAFSAEPRALTHLREMGGETRDEQLSDTGVEDFFLTFCKQNAVPCISLLGPVRRAVRAGEDLYFPWDGHMNRAGNRLLGQLMAQAVWPLLPPPLRAGSPRIRGASR